MVVKKGYKQTEVGLIPEDWKCEKVQSIPPKGMRYGIVDGPFGSNLKTIHYRTSGIPIITSGYVTDGRFKAESYLYVDKSKFLAEKRSEVAPGDIVMAKIGERCGASAILPSTHETGILSGNALKISIDNNRFSTQFVWYMLWSHHTFGKLEELRTTGAQPALSIASLKKYVLPIPPTLAEQEAIASALSDADAWIESLEQLIAKKRQIKQGAMQELLTGKRRLPGFSGEWETKRLGEIGITVAGLTYAPRAVAESGTLVLRASNVVAGTLVFIDNIFVKTDLPERVFVKTGDILICVRNGSRDLIGKCAKIPQQSETDRHVFGAFMCVYRTDFHDFVFHQFQSNVIKRQITEHLGATINQITNKSLNSFEIPIPEIPEQTAIATVLSDMDTEIESLESKLAKAREIKQGMMQELLTGRIRLI